MPYYRRSKARTKRSRYSRSNQRSNVWVRYDQKAIPPVGTAGSHPWDLLPDGLIDPGAVVGSTVTRIRGMVQINAGAVAGVYGGFFLAFAIADRKAEPLEDLPEPYGNANDVDWLYWEYISIADSLVGAWNTSDSSEYVFTYRFDAKSQRRISVPQVSLLGFIQPQSLSSTPVPTYNAVTSVLLKV